MIFLYRTVLNFAYNWIIFRVKFPIQPDWNHICLWTGKARGKEKKKCIKESENAQWMWENSLHLVDVELLTLERERGRERERRAERWKSLWKESFKVKILWRAIMRLYNGNFPTDNCYHLRISYTFSIEFLLFFFTISSSCFLLSSQMCVVTFTVVHK